MDDELAQLLGWHKSADGIAWEPTEHYVHAVTGNVPGAWQPTASLDDCAEAESIIAGWGLRAAYGQALALLLDPDVQIAGTAIYPSDPDDVCAWITMIATAPPEVRVRAMLSVLK